MSKYLIFILLLSGSLVGCTKKNVHFYQNHTASMTLGAELSPTLVISDKTGNIPTITEEQCPKFNTTVRKINSIYLKQLKLTIKDSAGQNFNFAKKFKLYINAPNLDETLVAYCDSVPDTSAMVLYLTPKNTDVKEYIKSKEFSWHLKTETDESIPLDVHLSVFSSFHINAKQNRIKKK